MSNQGKQDPTMMAMTESEFEDRLSITHFTGVRSAILDIVGFLRKKSGEAFARGSDGEALILRKVAQELQEEHLQVPDQVIANLKSQFRERHGREW